jgi:predicted DNA-binding transcriptional regulator YafY
MAKIILERLQRIDTLIRQQSTGSPRELGQKLGISERSARKYVNTLREMGAPISFSRRHNSYCYLEAGGFSFRFSNLVADVKAYGES